MFPVNHTPSPPIDFDAITRLFADSSAENRHTLFEHETYELLRNSGAESPPATVFLDRTSRPSDAELSVLEGNHVVLKVVSPTILHKTEVGGVRIVENRPDRIRSGWRRMLYEVVERYANQIESAPASAPKSYRGLSGDQLQQRIAGDIRGILMVQFMPPDSEAFGNELIVGIRNTREFGMVISAGLGGTDTELYARRFRKGQAIVAASTRTTDGPGFFELFRKTICYQKLAGLTRGQRRIVTDEQLVECFSSMIELANHYSPVNPEAPWIIEELEVNPFAFSDFLMVPLDGLCRFSPPRPLPAARPHANIDKLLRPESIGILGVSTTRRNFGRVILDNIVSAGFPKENLRIFKPDLETFEGIQCLPDLAAIDAAADNRLDLLVVAIGAEGLEQIVKEILSRKSARAVMLIAGGLGETEDSQSRAAMLEAHIQKTREENPDKVDGPVFLGGNCLGVVSHPGKYDTLFIPEQKLPKQRKPRKRCLAFVSQSGAFMITRLSKRPEIDPAYMVSVGNQNDLTLGDMLHYLKDDDAIDVIGIYAEGFRDLDGLSFIMALQEAVIAGKDVIFYKAGRTPEGKTATSGHTASLAGDYMVCESCVRQAGGIVARTFTEFEDLLMLSQRLHGKRVFGNRLAAVSGAGFEAVGMADSILSDEYSLAMARISNETRVKIEEQLRNNGLEGLVEVRNPLDLNPAADDELHCKTVSLLLADRGVDAVVVGLDPLSPATRSLDLPTDHRFSLQNPKSIANLLPGLYETSGKPVVGVVDGGRLYDPLVDRLMMAGIPIFRSADRAVQTLAAYIEGCLHAERLKMVPPAGTVE